MRHRQGILSGTLIALLLGKECNMEANFPRGRLRIQIRTGVADLGNRRSSDRQARALSHQTSASRESQESRRIQPTRLMEYLKDRYGCHETRSSKSRSRGLASQRNPTRTIRTRRMTSLPVLTRPGLTNWTSTQKFLWSKSSRTTPHDDG